MRCQRETGSAAVNLRAGGGGGAQKTRGKTVTSRFRCSSAGEVELSGANTADEANISLGAAAAEGRSCWRRSWSCSTTTLRPRRETAAEVARRRGRSRCWYRRRCHEQRQIRTEERQFVNVKRAVRANVQHSSRNSAPFANRYMAKVLCSLSTHSWIGVFPAALTAFMSAPARRHCFTMRFARMPQSHDAVCLMPRYRIYATMSTTADAQSNAEQRRAQHGTSYRRAEQSRAEQDSRKERSATAAATLLPAHDSATDSQESVPAAVRVSHIDVCDAW